MSKFFHSLLFVSIGLLLGCVICFFVPETFRKSELHTIVPQYDYYRSIQVPGKILVVGGSSVAFGIDLDTLEAKTGRPCAEFGVHMDMGYSFLLEASKCNLRSGDVVVIEYFDRKLDDFLPEVILSGIGKRTDMYRYFLPRYGLKVIKEYPRYIMKSYFYSKVKYQDNGYNDLKFDSRGCLITLRNEKNSASIEEFTHRGKTFSQPVAQDLMDYLNEYVDYCKSLNVRVFFTYPPYFDEHLDWCEEDGNHYAEVLASKLHAPLITNLKDAIYSREYIWGHFHHLTTEGARIRSTRLADALKPYLESEGASSAY